MSSMMEQFAGSLTWDSLRSAKDLKQRLLFTFMCLIIYRVGSFIPLPGINPEALSAFFSSTAGGMIGIMDMFSGGALSRMTVFALSITPYISSSIIIQLASTVYPPFQALRKEGEIGRKKLNRYTRFLTVVIAVLQGLATAFFVESMSSVQANAVVINVWLFRIITTLTLTGGTLFLMWIGEQITSRGIGNGISLIIYSGIMASFPIRLIRAFIVGKEEGAYYVAPVVLCVIAVAFAYVILFEKAQRKVPIQYPRRNIGVGSSSANMPSYMPLKVNMSGVMPPIFTQSILSLPIMIAGYSFAGNEYVSGVMAMMRHGHPFYIAVFSLLVIFFAFFYTFLMFDVNETADNLKKSQAYIPGIRPGAQTAKYLKDVIMRLTVVGSVYLASVCAIPELIMMNMPVNIYLGGTTILIIVSVTIESITQIQTHLFAHQYKGLVGRVKKRLK